MKNKSGMANLRRKIVLCFIIVLFAVRVIDSVIDSIWDTFIAPEFYPDGDYTGIVDIGTVGYISLSFVVYIISAAVFYLLVRKMIRKESLRQVKEQNLLYAAIAHDLKTPIASVQGFAKALMQEKIRSEEKEEIYEIIYNKSKSMNELIDTLFDYSKFGTEEYRMVFEEVDLCVLLRDIIAENYCDLEDCSIDPEIDIPDEPIIVKADKKELKRAVSNLVINTYKHNPAGIKVLIRLSKNENEVRLVIADSGNKIAEGMKVFEPFVTENSSRTAGKGTGLGLAITKRILDEHNARITVNNNIPEYTKAFVVSFQIIG